MEHPILDNLKTNLRHPIPSGVLFLFASVPICVKTYIKRKNLRAGDVVPLEFVP